MKNLKTLAILFVFSVFVLPVVADAQVVTRYGKDGNQYSITAFSGLLEVGSNKNRCIATPLENAPILSAEFIEARFKYDPKLNGCVPTTPEERAQILHEREVKEKMEQERLKIEREARIQEEVEVALRIQQANALGTVETPKKEEDNKAELASLWEQVRLLQEILSLLIAKMSVR